MKTYKRITVGIVGTTRCLVYDVDWGYGDLEMFDNARKLAEAELKKQGLANTMELMPNQEPEIWIESLIMPVKSTCSLCRIESSSESKDGWVTLAMLSNKAVTHIDLREAPPTGGYSNICPMCVRRIKST